MAQKQLIISFNTDGSTVVDAQNFAGKGCAEASQAIEMALSGGDSGNIDSKKKPDYYATNQGANLGKI